jgi:6-phosphofructokinase 1
LKPPTLDSEGAFKIASEIITKLGLPWHSADDLPLNPHLFSYEKDIIDFFSKKEALGQPVFTEASDSDKEAKEIRRKLIEGCPSDWPNVARWERPDPIPNLLEQEDFGKHREENASVLTAALISPGKSSNEVAEVSAVRNLCFPEAGPRQSLYFPVNSGLRVAVLVSGGIAPGINAVIDGIVQRHWLYAEHHGYKDGLTIFGLQNGFRAFEKLSDSHRLLAAKSSHVRGTARGLDTSNHVNEGGSILGTSRVDDLVKVNSRSKALKAINQQLSDWGIDILYVIGGDGSMRAAHAIWSMSRESPDRDYRPLSVIAIPKTMDNDILWVWQSFGFLSAVEKAREIIESLHTEVISNPRLCVAQLFGSDSGFVVSHAVLASATGSCLLALIPEVPFKMTCIAKYLKKRISLDRQVIPYGLVIMSETAIPLDAMDYVGNGETKPLIDIGLSDDEKDAIRKFDVMRMRKERIQGQTNDALRTAGLKIVSRGLQKLLPNPEIVTGVQHRPDWSKLRVFTNEPRHLLRAIPPSCSDIIIGHRLGTLAVDNAMAGYTDFMISQWLTEYVLVPLKLVTLGRKRIPTTGIFWKSVLAKTGQPSDLTCPNQD